MAGILGKKIGMSRFYQDDGRVIPVTIIECTPNVVTQVKTTEKEGYPAIVLGFGERKHITKTKKFYNLKEFRISNEAEYKLNDKVTVEALEGLEKVNISGYTRGRGNQGVVKRWGFGGFPASHGHPWQRVPGSISGSPSGVFRGQKMGGHMGDVRQTLKNRKVVRIDKENNLIAIKGNVPGSKNSLVEISW